MMVLPPSYSAMVNGLGNHHRWQNRTSGGNVPAWAGSSAYAAGKGRARSPPASTKPSTTHFQHTGRTSFAKHTACKKGIDFYAATISSTGFSPSLPSPHPTGSSGGVVGAATSDALATDGRRTSTLVKRAEEMVGLPEEGLYEESRVHENLVWRREVPRGRGLFNNGNKCFLNATLQCLAFLPPLAQHFLEEDYSEAMPASASCTEISVGKRQQAPPRDVLVIVGNLIKQVLRRGQTANYNTDVIRPTELLRNLRLVGPQYRHDTQEDAHEFLRQLLQTMADSCLARTNSKPAASSNSLRKETTAIHKIFGGYLRSRLKCRNCGHKSDKYEQFLDLSLELPKGVTTVEGALEAFTSVEHLKGSNRWCCNVCKKLVEAEKNLTVFKPPNALVVHLKRFAGQGRELTKTKTQIGFGESLVVKVSGPEGRAVYDLTGVVQHLGEGQRRGHYIALVKTSKGKWCQADDAKVFEVSRRQVASAEAYILFYTRRRPELALAAPSSPTLPPPLFSVAAAAAKAG
ncbi:unnamed protein product [Ascophyllum nodosum]